MDQKVQPSVRRQETGTGGTSSWRNADNKFETRKSSLREAHNRDHSDATVNTAHNRQESIQHVEDWVEGIQGVRIEHKASPPATRPPVQEETAPPARPGPTFQEIPIEAAEAALRPPSRARSNQQSRYSDGKSSQLRKRELQPIQQIHEKNELLKKNHSISENQMYSPAAASKKSARSAGGALRGLKNDGKQAEGQAREWQRSEQREKKQGAKPAAGVEENAGAAKFQNETIQDSVNSRVHTGSVHSMAHQQNLNEISFANAQMNMSEHQQQPSGPSGQRRSPALLDTQMQFIQRVQGKDRPTTSFSYNIVGTRAIVAKQKDPAGGSRANAEQDAQQMLRKAEREPRTANQLADTPSRPQRLASQTHQQRKGKALQLARQHQNSTPKLERGRPSQGAKQPAEAQQNRTYLEKLYAVDGNSFKLVRQPKRKKIMGESATSVARRRESNDPGASEAQMNLYKDELAPVGPKARKHLASGVHLSASYVDSGLNQSTQESVRQFRKNPLYKSNLYKESKVHQFYQDSNAMKGSIEQDVSVNFLHRSHDQSLGSGANRPRIGQQSNATEQHYGQVDLRIPSAQDEHPEYIYKVGAAQPASHKLNPALDAHSKQVDRNINADSESKANSNSVMNLRPSLRAHHLMSNRPATTAQQASFRELQINDNSQDKYQGHRAESSRTPGLQGAEESHDHTASNSHLKPMKLAHTDTQLTESQEHEQPSLDRSQEASNPMMIVVSMPRSNSNVERLHERRLPAASKDHASASKANSVQKLRKKQNAKRMELRSLLSMKNFEHDDQKEEDTAEQSHGRTTKTMNAGKKAHKSFQALSGFNRPITSGASRVLTEARGNSGKLLFKGEHKHQLNQKETAGAGEDPNKSQDDEVVVDRRATTAHTNKRKQPTFLQRIESQHTWQLKEASSVANLKPDPFTPFDKNSYKNRIKNQRQPSNPSFLGIHLGQDAVSQSGINVAASESLINQDHRSRAKNNDALGRKMNRYFIKRSQLSSSGMQFKKRQEQPQRDDETRPTTRISAPDAGKTKLHTNAGASTAAAIDYNIIDDVTQVSHGKTLHNVAQSADLKQESQLPQPPRSATPLDSSRNITQRRAQAVLWSGQDDQGEDEDESQSKMKRVLNQSMKDRNRSQGLSFSKKIEENDPTRIISVFDHSILRPATSFLQPVPAADDQQRNQPKTQQQTTQRRLNELALSSMVRSMDSRSMLEQGEHLSPQRKVLDLDSAKKFRQKAIAEREGALIRQFGMYEQLQKYNQMHEHIEAKNEPVVRADMGGDDLVGPYQDKADGLVKKSQSQRRLRGASAQAPSYSQYESKKSIGGVQSQWRKDRLTIYEKKALEFKKVYRKTLQNLRKMPESLLEEPTSEKGEQIEEQSSSPWPSARGQAKGALKDLSVFKISDINIIQRNTTNLKLISNRIRLLAKQDRPYLNQDRKNRKFDPIRSNIRMLPYGNIHMSNGRSAQFYYIEACIHALRNDLTFAIQSLHTGLRLEPTNLQCRFTHGVLMFKLGLLSQAEFDFEVCTRLHPKERLCFFNYALTLLQRNRKEHALEVIEEILEKNVRSGLTRAEYELMHDAYMLKAQCLWRLKRPIRRDGHQKREGADGLAAEAEQPYECYPLEAIKCFELAKKFKARYDDRETVRWTTKQLEDQLKDFAIREMKSDIIQDVFNFEANKSKSPRAQHVADRLAAKPIVADLKENEEQRRPARSAKGRASKPKVEQLPVNEQDRDIRQCLLNAQRSKSAQMTPSKADEADRPRRSQALTNSPDLSPDAPAVNRLQPTEQEAGVLHLPYAASTASVQDLNMASQSFMQPKPQRAAASIPQSPPPREEHSAPNRPITEKSIASATAGPDKSKSPKSGVTMSQKSLSTQARRQLEELKNELRKRLQDKAEYEKTIFSGQVESFYKKLRRQSLQNIDAGHNVRFDKVYGHLMKPEHHEKLIDLIQKQSVDFPLPQSLETSTINEVEDPNQYTEEELQQIQMRLKVQHEEKEQIEEVEARIKQNKESRKFVEFMIRGRAEGTKASAIKVKKIEGTNFSENGVVEINQDNQQLDKLLVELQQKFKEVSAAMTRELDREEEKLYNRRLKDEDLTEYRNASPTKGDAKSTIDNSVIYQKDKVMQKLRDNLTPASRENVSLPYDICNILKAEIDQKKKMRRKMEQAQVTAMKRIENRKMIMIRKEFETVPGPLRSFAILDLILGGLKFFQRFNLEQRRLIYQHAQIRTEPAQAVIFNQDEEGDEMYVILKGRVAVQQTSEESGNMPRVVYIKNDGEQFGELSLLDQDKVDCASGKDGTAGGAAEQHQKFARRTASCITTELTDMLVLDSEFSQQLLQPGIGSARKSSVKTTKKREEGLTKRAFSSARSQASVQNDEVSRRVRILQKIPHFKDIDPRFLMRIAANVVTKTYRYGEYLVRRGEVPKGLFLIIKGQCKVIAQRYGQRKIASNSALAASNAQKLRRGGSKLGIVDKTLHNFNPVTSVLNQPSSCNERTYQNARVRVDENNREIKDRIQYVDLMTFSRLTRGNTFGSRVLIPYEHFVKMSTALYGANSLEKYYPVGCDVKAIEDEKDEEYHMKSLLSITADSATVDVWILDHSDIGYLSQKDAKLVYESIMATKDADRPMHEQDIEFIIEQFQKWDKYKVEVVDEVFDRQAMIKYFKAYDQ